MLTNSLGILKSRLPTMLQIHSCRHTLQYCSPEGTEQHLTVLYVSRYQTDISNDENLLYVQSSKPTDIFVTCVKNSEEATAHCQVSAA